MDAAEPSLHPDRCVLVVEDEPLVRSFLVEALARSGYAVLEAPTAEAALAVVESGAPRAAAPEALVTDVRLPGMSGPALVRRLRERNPRLRVLYVTGYPGDDALVEGSGDDGPCLPKPFRAAQLVQAVSALFGGSEPRP